MNLWKMDGEEMTPAISVIMTVYNTEKYIHEAIQSILDQSLGDFELIIINDASTDQSSMIIESYKDSRIRVVNNKQNLGASKSSNIGLKLARGKYIARMDSDDVSLPERLSKQYHYMELHPDVAVLGTWARIIGEQESTWIYPKDDMSNKCQLFFNACFAHSSIMIRRSVLETYNITYNTDFTSAIDYELYSQFPRQSIFENLPEVLYIYRRHQNQMSTVSRSRQKEQANIVRLKQLRLLGIFPSEEDFKLHIAICERQYSDFFTEMEYVKRAAIWLEYLRERNQELNIFENAIFEKKLASYWLNICENYSFIDSRIWNYSLDSNLSKWIYFPEKQISIEHFVVLLSNLRNIVIFGTGRMACFLAEILKRKGYVNIAFLDNNQNKVGRKLNGINIYRPEWLSENSDQVDAVIISVLGNHDQEIKEQLQEVVDTNKIRVYSWKQAINL